MYTYMHRHTFYPYHFVLNKVHITQLHALLNIAPSRTKGTALCKTQFNITV